MQGRWSRSCGASPHLEGAAGREGRQVGGHAGDEERIALAVVGAPEQGAAALARDQRVPARKQGTLCPAPDTPAVALGGLLQHASFLFPSQIRQYTSGQEANLQLAS
jgi:hypothetical protein